jgi:thiol-disulfide isomerase/thioredoxin
MKHFNNINISYLEIDDISNGKLKPYVTKGKKTIVMASGLFCGYCTQAKPAFAELAKQLNGKVTCCTIQIDGKDTEKQLSEWLKKWDKNYQGVPVYLIFSKDGIYEKTHNGGRDINSLMESIK